MSWGTELWDQYENIAAHTQKGIDFLEKFGNFIKDRCAIELEYASKLRRLVKNHHPKKKDDEESQFTACVAFVNVMKEIGDLAGQHELIAENLTTSVAKEIVSVIKELKEERKRHLQEGAKTQSNLQHSLTQLDKTKKNYERAFREAEKAQESFHKADADFNLSRAEVEKAKNISTTKDQQQEDTKTEYANQLQKTNNLQSQHYQKLMPDIFHNMQKMDEKRITSVQKFIHQTANVEKEVLPIIEKCLDGMIQAADAIQPPKDSRLVIDRYKSGFEPPEDVPFEDLSTMKNGDSTTTVSIPTIKADSATLRGTISVGKLKKRGGLFGIFGSNKNNGCEIKEDYSDLPPSQRRKKLQQKIENIQSQIYQETCARDGLMKIKAAYEQNSALGDPLTVEGQLTENGHKLDKLRQELHKFMAYLSEAEGKSITPLPHKRDRNSVSEDSLSRSASDSSVSNPVNNKTSIPGTPLPSHCPESGIGTSHTSIPDSDFDNGEVVDGEFYEPEPLPVLGHCKALYSFDAQSEGSIPMVEGDDFQVIELDQGDGWTRVRRNDNTEEGFVPSSYIECTLSNNCSNC